MGKTLTYFIKSSVFVLALTGLSLSATLLAPAPVVSADNIQKAKDGVKAIGGDEAGNKAGDLTKLIESIVNLLLFTIGVIAVIMIIIGGIRYTTSNGDQAQVTGAKNTILYSIVGLVVAIMAYAIVNWVLKSLG